MSEESEIYERLCALKDDARKHFEVVAIVVIKESADGHHTQQIVDGTATVRQTLDLAESFSTMSAQLIRGALAGKPEVVDVMEPPLP